MWKHYLAYRGHFLRNQINCLKKLQTNITNGITVGSFLLSRNIKKKHFLQNITSIWPWWQRSYITDIQLLPNLSNLSKHKIIIWGGGYFICMQCCKSPVDRKAKQVRHIPLTLIMTNSFIEGCIKRPSKMHQIVLPSMGEASWRRTLWSPEVTDYTNAWMITLQQQNWQVVSDIQVWEKEQ